MTNTFCTLLCLSGQDQLLQCQMDLARFTAQEKADQATQKVRAEMANQMAAMRVQLRREHKEEVKRERDERLQQAKDVSEQRERNRIADNDRGERIQATTSVMNHATTNSMIKVALAFANKDVDLGPQNIMVRDHLQSQAKQMGLALSTTANTTQQVECEPRYGVTQQLEDHSKALEYGGKSSPAPTPPPASTPSTAPTGDGTT